MAVDRLRDGRRQVLLARLITATNVDAPTERDARRAGELLAKTGTKDIVDALLVGRVKDGDTVLTSDPDDIDLLLACERRRARNRRDRLSTRHAGAHFPGCAALHQRGGEVLAVCRG
jgi:hypothetical protein